MTTLRTACGFAVAFALMTASCTGDVNVTSDIGWSSNPAVESIAGSYSRVLTVGDYLYAVDQTSIITYDIANRDNPAEVGRTEIGLAVETIYHHNGNLFIGSREGMFTYTIQDDGQPKRRGAYDYANLVGQVQPCDPVVANDETAFATLYSSDGQDNCGRLTNLQLLVTLDVSDLANPRLVSSMDVVTPRGLALDGDLLFVCNDASGFTVYDVSDRDKLREVSRVSNVQAWDAIADGGKLIIVGTRELVQFNYSDPTNLVELSRLPYRS